MALTEQEFNDLLDVTRPEWDPDEVRANSTRSWEDGIYIAEVHHTGAKGPSGLSFDQKRRWLLAVERFHELTNNWSDIFYNIFVFADGEIWEGRQPLRASQGNLAHAFTVHIPGNDTGMTEAQYASFLRVVHAITDGNPAFLRDHQARVGPSGTFCCGDNNRVFVERAKTDMITFNLQGTDMATIKELNDSGTAPEWAADAVAWAMLNDQVTDGSGEEDAPVTELRFLTMLYRAAQVVEANIPAGKDGRDGEDGDPGQDGRDGRDGVDGKDGVDGASADLDQVVARVRQDLEENGILLKQEATITFQ